MSEGEVCSHVKVVIRVRPLNAKETEGNLKNVVRVVDNHLLVFDPKETEVTFFRGQKAGNRDVRRRLNKDLTFIFDHVFGEDSTQMEVFENTTKGVVDGVLNGYNCTGKGRFSQGLKEKPDCVMPQHSGGQSDMWRLQFVFSILCSFQDNIDEQSFRYMLVAEKQSPRVQVVLFEMMLEL